MSEPVPGEPAALPRGPIDRGLEVVVVALFALLVVDVLWGVVSRYALGGQSRWTEEVAIHLLVWVSMLGGAVTYRERGHLGLDLLVGRLEPGARAMAFRMGDVAVAVFAVVVLLGGGGWLVSETLASGQVTPALGVKMGYLYACVPLAGLFFLKYAVAHLLASRGAGTEGRAA